MERRLGTEMKFRGKSINTGEWLYGYLAEAKYNSSYSSTCEKVIFENLESFNTDNFWYVVENHKVDKETICRPTFLHDKNGKDIYEGDILRRKYADEAVLYFVCVWIEEYACFAFREKSEYSEYNYFQKCDEKKLEIIGNIFDNPEFLTK